MFFLKNFFSRGGMEPKRLMTEKHTIIHSKVSTEHNVIGIWTNTVNSHSLHLSFVTPTNCAPVVWRLAHHTAAAAAAVVAGSAVAAIISAVVAAAAEDTAAAGVVATCDASTALGGASPR